MAALDTVTDDSFEEKVYKAGRPVLVDFTATWCGPCKAMAPALADLAREYQGEADILALDIDENPAVVEKFGIRGVPTFYLFKGEEIVYRSSGGQTRSMLAQAIEAALEAE